MVLTVHSIEKLASSELANQEMYIRMNVVVVQRVTLSIAFTD
jgi:hypothetical protein